VSTQQRESLEALTSTSQQQGRRQRPGKIRDQPADRGAGSRPGTARSPPAPAASAAPAGNVNERATRPPDGTLEIRDTGIFHNAVTDDGQRLFHQSGNHSFVLGPDDELISEVFHGLWQSEEAFPGKVCPILPHPL
jgi:hypothetical protein